ncbi:MAG: hypothetical protein KAX15_00805 [Candidatus Omnitrophica bacterium]|nr:hypothetical protein [Candidatus Omnitrophota bacterium]
MFQAKKKKNLLSRIKKNFKQSLRRATWFPYRKNRILKTKITDLLQDNVKLHLGCGDKKIQGYVNIDIVPTEGTDLVMDIAQGLDLIPSGIAAEIRLENVFEHLYRYQQNDTLEQFKRILKKDGCLIIKWLPDFDNIIQAYLKKEKGVVGETFDLFNVYRLTHGDPLPRNSPQQIHKDIFTKDTIKTLLENNGFMIEEMKNEVYPGEELALCVNIIAKIL